MFHADGQMDMTNLIAAFRIFANAPKIIGRVFVFQNVSKHANCCALLNRQVCVFIPQKMNVVFSSQSLKHEPATMQLKREKAMLFLKNRSVSIVSERDRRNNYYFTLTD